MCRKILKFLFYLSLIFLIIIVGDDETRAWVKKKVKSLRQA